ncbi:hypothetical protein V6N12_045538 [Hibiscus sabdariffa]|uniref:Putative plant transposon protein domain-containing protein n=1 Tax=Hibiscus sabdariffa TaxID=183260 RepID=A0ABR2G458_9ROSI
MPTSHNQTVDRTRLVLIHVILTGYRFNVGEVIAREISAACQNDKGILAFPCIISALCRRAAVPTSPSIKYTAEKMGWSKKEYMRKMDVAEATPIRMAMPTPPASPAQPTAATHDDAEPSTRPGAQPSPAATQQPSEAHSPTSIPAAPTPVSPLGSTTTPPSSPPPAQSDEAVPLHILQLRNQLQRIEARQLQFQSETKVFQQSLLNFLCFQFPAAVSFFSVPPDATPQANFSAATQPIPSANPSAKAGNTEEVHLSSDDENDIFDWQTPRGYPPAPRPTQQQAAATSARQSPDPADVPILQPVPIPAQPTMETHHQRKGKAPAGRLITRSDPSSPDEEAAQQPAQKRRRYHIITTDSDEEQSAAATATSADRSPSF